MLLSGCLLRSLACNKYVIVFLFVFFSGQCRVPHFMLSGPDEQGTENEYISGNVLSKI